MLVYEYIQYKPRPMIIPGRGTVPNPLVPYPTHVYLPTYSMMGIEDASGVACHLLTGRKTKS